jgi:hypothetical protein
MLSKISLLVITLSLNTAYCFAQKREQAPEEVYLKFVEELFTESNSIL